MQKKELNNYNLLKKALDHMKSSVFLIGKSEKKEDFSKSGKVLLNQSKVETMHAVMGIIPACMVTSEGELRCGFNKACAECNFLKHINQSFTNNSEMLEDISNDLFPGFNDKYFRYNSQVINYEGSDHVLLVLEKFVRSSENVLQSEGYKDIYRSIDYAKRIQKALLPDSMELHYVLKSYFLLYKPRDIIGGDFYWAARMQNKVILVAGDATGHGVPGALISVLGITALNDIVKSKGVVMPDQILSKLRRQIAKDLFDYESRINNLDGIDMSICTIDHSNKKIYFAGASSGIVIGRKGEIQIYKGDNLPLTPYLLLESYTLKEFEYEKGDMLFLFSDGYKDQFGGKAHKKIGRKQFYRILKNNAGLSMSNQKMKLNNFFKQWKGNEEQVDDILVLGKYLE